MHDIAHGTSEMTFVPDRKIVWRSQTRAQRARVWSQAYRAIARDVTTTPLRHFGAQPDFAVYGRDGELCCC